MNQLLNENSSKGSPFGAPSEAPLWKLVFDVTCVILGLPLVLPLIIAICVLIKIVSFGPVLFKQERVGYRGRRFQCYKFRSMKITSDQAVHLKYVEKLIDFDLPMTKMDVKGDSRLIPLGWLLRATGLDELPQLFNVLRGEMSLVGPRPCLPFEYERYLPWQRERSNTLPGLTGLWQVSGKNHTTFVEMMRLDIRYSRNKSLWLDIKILLRTIPAIVRQTRETTSQAPSHAGWSVSGNPLSQTAETDFHLGEVDSMASVTTESRMIRK